MNYWKSIEALYLALQTPEAFSPMRVERRETTTSIFFDCVIGEQRSTMKTFRAPPGYLKEIEAANVRAQQHANIYNSH